MPPDLRALMERYCTLALLLPEDDFDSGEDADRTAEVRMVLVQLYKIQK